MIDSERDAGLSALRWMFSNHYRQRIDMSYTFPATVKLSHAIREGAMLEAQSLWDQKHVGSSCVLGAAADHSGCTIEEGGDDRLLEAFPPIADEGRAKPSLRSSLCLLAVLRQPCGAFASHIAFGSTIARTNVLSGAPTALLSDGSPK